MTGKSLAFKKEPYGLRAEKPSNLDEMDFITYRFNRLIRQAVEQEKISINRAAEITVSQLRELKKAVSTWTPSTDELTAKRAASFMDLKYRALCADPVESQCFS